ncbi:MAG: hypothetical protein KF773_24145 [Deltaproteobacteria bacterium]|nr:hypothetical protein [Deltaproteobacteria bacterium]MCW5807108.1 hypothetical protein [Deltaproteobacteria bacterium]
MGNPTTVYKQCADWVSAHPKRSFQLVIVERDEAANATTATGDAGYEPWGMSASPLARRYGYIVAGTAFRHTAEGNSLLGTQYELWIAGPGSNPALHPAFYGSDDSYASNGVYIALVATGHGARREMFRVGQAEIRRAGASGGRPSKDLPRIVTMDPMEGGMARFSSPKDSRTTVALVFRQLR